MPTSVAPARNWFDQGGSDYARFRPAYPLELGSFLASLTLDKRLAVDVGCGTGQLTRLLAPRFDRVVGIDPSADQIANAWTDARIDYRCAPAESIPLAAESTSLVTAAQAAHWFDLPAFYCEVRRIARPGAVLVLVGYGVLELDPSLDERFQVFYRDEIGPYWPPQRKLVDAGYATIDFPFAERVPPSLEIRCEWSLPRFLGYLTTWSAVRNAREAGRDKLLSAFWNDMAAAWGAPGLKRSIRWPIHMRIGQL